MLHAVLLASALWLAAAPGPGTAQTAQPATKKTELEIAVEHIEGGRLDAGKTILEKLANANDPVAQFYLGDLFVRYAARADKPRGLVWLDLAAKAGVPNAMNRLAAIYSEGVIIARDESRAQELFMQAASLGFLEAYNNLGRRSMLGIGRPKDTFDAMEWYRLAADQGSAEAQQNLGAIIASSPEVSTNPKVAAEAYMWLTLAAKQGDPEAQALRAQFMKGMKPAEIAEGDRLVAAWKKIEPKKK